MVVHLLRPTGLLGPLIGRERELRRLSEMLDRPDVRLVTVTGPAGVGKTRVADGVAERASGGRRVMWVELESISDPHLVMDAIVDAAGGDDRRAALDAAVAAVAGDELLLVLDNFEQVAAAAGDVARLLAACPGVTALVTSRHVLHLAGEHMFPLAPLALPATGECDPARSPAVALFVARAVARDPEFALGEKVGPAVVEICRRLDGLPLAIELAAARVGALPPPAIVAHWEAVIGLDAQGACDLPARHSTLRRAFDWSYSLLGDEERALLRRLSAFAGGFDLGAVAAACRGDGGILPALRVEPVEALGGLVDRSLARREPRRPAHEPRYIQLRTVREYLRGQLAHHGEERAADLLMARAAARPWVGGFFAPARSRARRDRLEREQNTLRAALGVLVRHAPGEAVDLAADLIGLWTTRGVGEGRESVERALAAAGPQLAADRRARGLCTAALLAQLQGDYAGQRRLARAGLAAARAGTGPLTLARALYAEAMATGRGYREVLAVCDVFATATGSRWPATTWASWHARPAGPTRRARSMSGRLAVAGARRRERGRPRRTQPRPGADAGGRARACRDAAVGGADGHGGERRCPLRATVPGGVERRRRARGLGGHPARRRGGGARRCRRRPGPDRRDAVPQRGDSAARRAGRGALRRGHRRGRAIRDDEATRLAARVVWRAPAPAR